MQNSLQQQLSYGDIGEFSLKWSSRRRAIGLMVTTAGELVVTAPQGTPLSTIEQAVNRHRNWIRRKLAERREALDRIEPGRAYYLGRPYRMHLRNHALETVRLADGEIYLRRGGSQANTLKLLKAWYQQEAQRVLAERVRHYGRLMNLHARRLEIRDWRRHWGECQPREGVMRFNWRLVLLPLNILDYVVAHEVAHLAVPGHPPRFWQKLAKVMPDFEARRRWLNRYGSPFLLWDLENVALEAENGLPETFAPGKNST